MQRGASRWICLGVLGVQTEPPSLLGLDFAIVGALLPLCLQTLIVELESRRSSSQAGQPHCSVTSKTHSGTTVGSAPGTTPADGGHASCHDHHAESSELSPPPPQQDALQAAACGHEAELAALRKEVQQLRAENNNIYWLADECKRLRAELAALKSLAG